MMQARFVLLAALAATIGTAIDAPRAIAQGCYGSAGALILNRDTQMNNNPVVVDLAHSSLLSSNQLETGWKGGFYTDLYMDHGDEHAWNVRFFVMDDWLASASVSGLVPEGAWLPGPASLGDAAIDEFNATLSSNLTSLELNKLWYHSDRLTLFGGVRWISVDESLQLDFYDGGALYSEYDGTTNNDLVGVQSGATYVVYDENACLRVTTTGRAGLYGTNTRYSGEYENGGISTINSSASDIAFVGDLAVNASLFITDDCSLDLGYQLLWIDGIGLAGDQLPVLDWVNGTGISNDGSAFYHGFAATLTVYMP